VLNQTETQTNVLRP